MSYLYPRPYIIKLSADNRVGFLDKVGCTAAAALLDKWWNTGANTPREERVEDELVEHERTCPTCSAFLVAMRLEGKI